VRPPLEEGAGAGGADLVHREVEQATSGGADELGVLTADLDHRVAIGATASALSNWQVISLCTTSAPSAAAARWRPLPVVPAPRIWSCSPSAAARAADPRPAPRAVCHGWAGRCRRGPHPLARARRGWCSPSRRRRQDSPPPARGQRTPLRAELVVEAVPRPAVEAVPRSGAPADSLRRVGRPSRPSHARGPGGFTPPGMVVETVPC